MIFRALILIICASVLSTAAMGQAKVGTTGLRFLEMSPSVRANGMGEAGAALIDDYSFSINPASLGLLHPEGRRALTVYPVQTDFAAGDYRYGSFTTRLTGGRIERAGLFTLNIAYFVSRLKSDDIPITTYEYPSGTGEYFNISDIAHNLAVGFGVSGVLDAAVGVNFKMLRENSGDLASNGNAFDIGLLIKIPADRFLAAPEQDGETRWHLSPAIGLAYCNMGSDMELYEYPLPEFKRAGMAVPLGFEKMIDGRNTMLALFTPSFELRNVAEWDDRINYGAELELMEACAGRLGRYRIDWDYRYDTWGFGLKCRGIVRLTTDLLTGRPPDSYGETVKFFRDKLEIEFSFARERAYWSGNNFDYYGVTISL